MRFTHLLLALVLVLACSQVKRLTSADRLGPDDKLQYLILASLNPNAGVQYLSEPTAAARSAYSSWFWRNSQFVAGKDTAAQKLYWQRALEAKNFFGTIDLMNDERVKTYIRYGPPHREAYQPKPVQHETLRIVVNPAEIWTYENLGRQFDFVKTGTAYKLVGESRFGPNIIAPSLEQVDFSQPAPEPAAQPIPLDLKFALIRLEQHNDTVEVELHYGIPQNQLAQIPTGNLLPLIHIYMEFKPHTNSSPVSRCLWVTPGITPDSSDNRLAVAREVFHLHADVYTVSVQAISSEGSAECTQTGKLNLLDYVKKAQPISDIVFCSLADSTFQAVQFERLGWRRLVPMIVPKVRSGQTFYLLYELYNLGLDQEAWHRAEARYEIIEQTTRQFAIVPTPAKFISGPGSEAVVVERVHTMDLRPGDYLLVARIHDLEKKRDISLTARFRIVPR
ncbi:hypothetical protein CH330_07635 [candidate division WOR-3 bacterium JGI_Cruoil_03_51_56]|uniref:GWxTD domain-containing protein n=1 Tax=candidate division WOR-3 bacterium JGI_Cruoil_03_51_56 TaxID=1973747 RepID=A0A235BQM1_UNCW3|nr:MAG: hypothetical protein CH330_07635 [candidate division WOR-3 bacterium JGI_Cruoil_03_51_56]